MMNRPLAIAAAAGALIAIPALAANTPPDPKVLPGYWEYSYRLAGIPVSKEHKCLKPDEISRFFDGPQNRHYKCTYPTKVVGDGKAQFIGTCVDKRGRTAPMNAQGTYTPTNFNLKLRVRTINGIPMSGSMNAKWLGASCPA